MMKTYSKEFSEAYHTRLNNMVERRMYSAIKYTGSFWYTAWDMAGRPSIKEIMGEEVSDTKDETIEKAYSSGKIIGREHDK